MRKRERENPCGVCGHYHKFEEGEVCGICGHRPVLDDKPTVHLSAFPSEILPEFLYLGSYDNASRSELLKTQGISCILNRMENNYATPMVYGVANLFDDTVPACQNLYKNSFTYHCLQDNTTLQFDDAIQFLEQCEREKARVLVHCMSGKSRSPAYVVAYLMKSKGWSLQQSYQWVKDKRPVVEIAQGVLQQLQEYEQKIFSTVASNNSTAPPQIPSNSALPVLNFGFPKPDSQVATPAFNSVGTVSIFSRPELDIPAREFTFGSEHTPMANNSGGNTGNNNNIPMDSS